MRKRGPRKSALRPTSGLDQNRTSIVREVLEITLDDSDSESDDGAMPVSKRIREDSADVEIVPESDSEPLPDTLTPTTTTEQVGETKLIDGIQKVEEVVPYSPVPIDDKDEETGLDADADPEVVEAESQKNLNENKTEGSTEKVPTDDETPTCSRYLNRKTKTEARNGSTVGESDNDKDEEEDKPSNNGDISRIKDLESAIGRFTDTLRTLLAKEDYEKIELKILETLSKVKSIKVVKVDYKGVCQMVEDLKDKMETKRRPWANVKELLKVLDKVKNNIAVDTPDKIARKIKEIEKIMEEIQAKIEEIDIEELDFDETSNYDSDDDRNSPYLICSRLKKRYMAYAKKLLSLQEPTKVKRNTVYTGRPVQKKIEIAGISRYPDIDKAVENAVNLKGSLWRNAMSYGDIHHIIQKCKQQNKLLISEDDMRATAIELLEYVTRKLKHRRKLDLQLALRVEDKVIDPADNDEELRKKLEENRRLCSSEAEVFQQYVQKQNQVAQPLEIHDDVSEASEAESLPEPDDEDETTDSDVEECDEDGKIIVIDRSVKKQRREVLKLKIKSERESDTENENEKENIEDC